MQNLTDHKDNRTSCIYSWSDMDANCVNLYVSIEVSTSMHHPIPAVYWFIFKHNTNSLFFVALKAATRIYAISPLNFLFCCHHFEKRWCLSCWIEQVIYRQHYVGNTVLLYAGNSQQENIKMLIIKSCGLRGGIENNKNYRSSIVEQLRRDGWTGAAHSGFPEQWQTNCRNHWSRWLAPIGHRKW